MLNQLLIDSWSFFKAHVVAISIIILPIVVPTEVLTALYKYFLTSDEYVLSEQIIPVVIGIIVYPIYAVGVIFYIASIISGESLGTKTLWKLGIKFWTPYLILNLLVGLAVMFGLFLLIIPGVIFTIRYAFSAFELLLNQSDPLDAMRSSWNETKEYMWIILGGYAVITLICYGPYYFITLFFDETRISYFVLDITSNIVYSVIGVIYTIFTFRVYEFAKLQHSRSLSPDAS